MVRCSLWPSALCLCERVSWPLKKGLETERTFHHAAINACLIFLLDLLLHAWLQ
jgi:hypothetical protein